MICATCLRTFTLTVQKRKKYLIQDVDLFCSAACAVQYIKNGPEAEQPRRIIRLVDGPKKKFLSEPRESWDAITHGFYRSDYERQVARVLKLSGLQWSYEDKTLDLGDNKVYTPDFYCCGYLIEVKGLWTGKARKKFKKAMAVGLPMVLWPGYLQADFKREAKKLMKETNINEIYF